MPGPRWHPPSRSISSNPTRKTRLNFDCSDVNLIPNQYEPKVNLYSETSSEVTPVIDEFIKICRSWQYVALNWLISLPKTVRAVKRHYYICMKAKILIIQVILRYFLIVGFVNQSRMSFYIWTNMDRNIFWFAILYHRKLSYLCFSKFLCHVQIHIFTFLRKFRVDIQSDSSDLAI